MGTIVEFGPDPAIPPPYRLQLRRPKRDAAGQNRSTPYNAALEQAEATLQQSEADLLQLQAKLRQAERDGSGPRTCCPTSRLPKRLRHGAGTTKSAKANVAAGVAAIRQKRPPRIPPESIWAIAPSVAGRRHDHRTPREHRANRGRRPQRPQLVPHRQGPAEDAGVGFGQRGRHRADPRWTCPCTSRWTLTTGHCSRRSDPDPHERPDDAKRGHLHGDRDGRQFPRQTLALHDGQRAIRGRKAARGCCWRPTRRCAGRRRRNRSTPAAGGWTAIAPAASQERGRLWIANAGGLVRPLDVKIGATDGTMTEISGDGT